MRQGNREFFITAEYLAGLNRNGQTELLRWLPLYDGEGRLDREVAHREGKYVDYGEAEELLYRCRKNGVGPGAVQRIMVSGMVEV
jgi:hypothetical protein